MPQANVAAIEYDPSRGPRLALIEYHRQNQRLYFGSARSEMLVTGGVFQKAIEAKSGNRMKSARYPSWFICIQY